MIEKDKLVATLISVLFLSFLKHTIDHGLYALPLALQLTAYAALPIAGGLIMVSLCSLLGVFTDVENAVTSRLLTRVSEEPTRNFLAGFGVTAYLALVRPPLTAYVPSLPYVEWFAIALAVYFLYTMTNLSSKQFYVSSEDLGWKKHVQEVKQITGQELIRITSAMEQFVGNGVKEPLLVHLTLYLQRLGETEESILKTLSPLMGYQNDAQRDKRSLLSFPWAKRKLSVKAKEARENLLNTLLDKIDRLRLE